MTAPGARSTATGPRLAPHGRCLEILAGGQRAVVTESGATLRSYEVRGRPVVEPFDGPGSPVVGSQGEVLAPWPNRVADGRWRWRGAEHQLALTEPERGHALHGLVRTLAWDVVERRGDAVTLEVLLLAHPGWPFPLRLRATYRVGPGGLTATLTAVNVGRDACPYGAGAHPYLALGGGPVDAAVLRVDADTFLETDERLVPTARRPAAGTAHDLTDGSPVGGRRLDTAFTGLARRDGIVEARLTAPDGPTTVVWGGPAVRWWQVYTGDTLPGRWRRATLAVEPQTCPPDALRSGEDLVVLEPGGRHVLAWGLAVE